MPEFDLSHLQERWKAFAATKRGKRAIKAGRLAFLAVVVGVLVYQMTDIGWGRVVSSLPQNPVFYLLLLAMYFLLPATEALIYGRLWRLHPLACLPIMIRKRVLNVDVVGYSGEIYLFTWAKSRVSRSARELMGTIKDNLIVSSAASFSAAAVLIAGLMISGQVDLREYIEAASPLYAGLGAVAAVFVAVVIFRFRHVIFLLPRRAISVLAGAHLLRFFAGYVLQIAAWWVVVPSASFQTWAILLVVFVVINRIPFLPSSDLVFVSAGAGLSPMLDVPVAPVVSMLLVRSAFDRLLNLVLFSTTVWQERQTVSIQQDAPAGPRSKDVRRSEQETREVARSLNS